MLALPPYGKLTASSEKSYKKGSSCLADDGHIMTNKAWCAKENNGKIQFELTKVFKCFACVRNHVKKLSHWNILIIITAAGCRVLTSNY